ncbi:MAG: RrF2 family transcriptional regulator [Planctomycetota bacterium]|jgi:Rrf2 family protein
MLFTRKTDYALVALAGLARRNHGSSSARDLADELKLPLPVLRNILKLLASHGLLVSSRGPSGGSQLARPAGDITLAQVIEVIEGPIHLVRCCSTTGDEEPQCQLVDSCLIKGNVRRVHESLMDFLNRVTLAELAPDAVGGPDAPETLRFGVVTP